MAAILIVDDDAAMRDALEETVRGFGHQPLLASSGSAALALLDEAAVGAVLLDLRMHGMDGLDVLRRIHERGGRPPVTVLTAYASAANTIEAMRLGAYDHLTKPVGREELASALNRMLAVGAGAIGHLPIPGGDGLVGSSEAMRTIHKTIGLLADSNATVLITGETGTGKELVARAIHDHGRRRDRSFIAINCAAIPTELMESELFGHLRGAFTGAVRDRAGAFREADRGTLFLDEIGDMDLAMQAKLLRALQERAVTPVGGKPVPTDVRIIAATHRDLGQLVGSGRFREDLYYRLHVVPIHLPPLRGRRADIVPLAEHFLSQASGKKLAPDAAGRLIEHRWPGNVRELKNAMERAGVLARGDFVSAAELKFIGEARTCAVEMIEWPEEDLPSAVARLEELLIRRSLARSAGNRAEAARQLGIHRQLLYAKIRRYGLDMSEIRTGLVADEDTQPRA